MGRYKKLFTDSHKTGKKWESRGIDENYLQGVDRIHDESRVPWPRMNYFQ